MIIKDKSRKERILRSAKGCRRDPAMIVYLGPSLGLASVYIMDGRAVVNPASAGFGLLVCEWSKWMRFWRRHLKT